MDLVICPKCGRAIPADFYSCPKCGYSFQSTTKRILQIVFWVFLSLATVAFLVSSLYP